MFTTFLKNISLLAKARADGYDVADFRIGTVFGSVILILIQIANQYNQEDIPNLKIGVPVQIFIQILAVVASYFVIWVKRWANEIGNAFSMIYGIQVALAAFFAGFPIEKAAVALIIIFGLMSMFKAKRALSIYFFLMVFVNVLLIILKPPLEMSQSFAITMSLLFLSVGFYAFQTKLDYLESVAERETDLAKSEAWFRAIFNHAPIGIIMFDEHYKPFKINTFFQNLTGFTEGELVEKNQLIKLVHPDDLMSKEKFIDFFEQGFTTHEQRFYTKNEQIIWLRMEMSPMIVDGKNYLIGMFSDVSAEKQTEEQLQKSSEALRLHNEALQEFSYVVSHDLQEPLRMITSFSQIIQKRHIQNMDEATNRDFGFVIDGAKRMSTLIRDMLEYSRWTAKSLPLGHVSLNHAMDLAIKNLTVAIESSGAKIKFDELPKIVANELMIVQLLQNLLSNAMKYRQPNRPLLIELTVEKQATNWLFSIKDNGIGFETQYKDKIFGIFQRLSTDRATGNGIGLAICKRLVERQGGRIWATSNLDVGSSFYFTLPKLPDSQIDLEEPENTEGDAIELPEGFLKGFS